MVWVNGHNLGRYWGIGPQQTLYLPAPWLKKGRNEVVVYESNGVTTPVLQGLVAPILNRTISASERHRKTGQTLNLDALTPNLAATLANSAAWQTFKLPKAATGRYLVLESLNSHSGDAFAALAELVLQDANGGDLPRTDWKTAYADSEELDAENGSADNVFDLQATTFWHSQWSGGKKPAHPHQFVIDLGANHTISGVRLLQRPADKGTAGRIKDFRIFVTPDLPPGL